MVNQGLGYNSPLLTRILPKLEEQQQQQPLPSLRSYFEVVGASNVVLDTVKRAEDSNDVVVRFYEAYGGRSTFQLKTTLPVVSACTTNLLEDVMAPVAVQGNVCTLTITPFQVLTVKLSLKA